MEPNIYTYTSLDEIETKKKKKICDTKFYYYGFFYVFLKFMFSSKVKIYLKYYLTMDIV